MPELPEVEAVAAKVRRDALNARIRKVLVLRPGITRPQKPAHVETAAGDRLIAVERRGKNILLRLGSGRVLRIHLRMTGNLYAIPDARLFPHTARLVFALHDGRGLVYDDPRALGRVHLHTPEELAPILDEIGIEPFSEQFTVDTLIALARSTRKPAKLFLMDQSYVAGVGNMYAAEALFRARIDPRRPIDRVSRTKLNALHEAILGVLGEAMSQAALAYERPGDYGDIDFAVYGREGELCLHCERRRIQRIPQGGRSTYFCPGCQR